MAQNGVKNEKQCYKRYQSIYMFETFFGDCGVLYLIFYIYFFFSLRPRWIHNIIDIQKKLEGTREAAKKVNFSVNSPQKKLNIFCLRQHIQLSILVYILVYCVLVVAGKTLSL